MFGRALVANSDLQVRFDARAALNVPLRSIFYATGGEARVDYPTLDDAAAAP